MKKRYSRLLFFTISCFLIVGILPLNKEFHSPLNSLDKEPAKIPQKAVPTVEKEKTLSSSYSSPTTNPTLFSSPLPSSTPIEDLPATTTIIDLEVSNMEQYFTKTKINDEIYNRIKNKSYKKDSIIPLDDLRYIRVLHYGFDHETHIGELIVNQKIADTVIEIFRELYEAKYPIEKMVLIDNYSADDEASMEDNNSSCFNYRVIDGTTKLSKHSQGVAIDINPLYNPYVRPNKGDRTVLPLNGAIYADRSLACPYYIDKNDLCYQIFTKYGFTWGGNWSSSKDYQHFQILID